MWLKNHRAILIFVICLHVCPNLLTVGWPTNDGESKNSADPACPHETFHCHNQTETGRNCIPHSWVCDGDEDCPNGEDERVNCTIQPCDEGQFRCLTGAQLCISESFICDGEEDCIDGSDESPKECSGVANFRCLPNQYLCPDTHHCIPVSKLCDSVIDCHDSGVDEGAHCANYGCRHQECELDLCRETIKGPQCYCQEGYTTNNSKCEDFNECEFDGYCDQLCKNTVGSYKCSCTDGYKSSKKAVGTCEANNSDEATMLLTTYFKLLNYNLKSNHTDDVTTGDKITTVDFDVKNNTACWIEYNKSTGETELCCSHLHNTSIQWTVKTQFKLTSVNQIAKDWVSGNWYFADEKRDRIFLCTPDGQHCLTVLNHGISQPKTIAIDASRGYFFYGDWSDQPKIGRAVLDGSEATIIATKKVVQPSCITLDYANSHMYWGDAFHNIIERVNYDGSQRRTVTHSLKLKIGYGLTMFENYLFVTNMQVWNHSVIRLHRFDHTDKPKIVKDKIIKPGAVQIFHPVRQPGYMKVICKNKCSHICIPVPTVRGLVQPKCFCRAGYMIVNETECQKQVPDTFLIYSNAQEGSIHGVSLDPDVSHDVMEPIYNLNRPVALAYHAEAGEIYFSDVGKLHIAHRDINGKNEAQLFLQSGVTICEGLAVDWIGNNLYWTDDGYQTISVVSLRDTTRSHTVLHGTNHSRSIVVDPNRGYMYWINLLWQPHSGIKAKIEKAAMDGSERKDLVAENIQWPNSLTLDSVNERLYWTDAYFDTIESVKTNGEDRRLEYQIQEKGHSHPYGLAVHNNSLYWTESLKGLINMCSVTKNRTIHMHNVSAPLFDLVLIDKETQPVRADHPCLKNNGDCSDLCLSVPNSRVCACGKGRKLADDNITCKDITGYTPGPVCDENFKFRCNNEECINIRQKCDGNYDCADMSDEDDGVCKTKNITCPDQTMFACGNKRCIYAQFVCDGEADCFDESDEHVDLCKQERVCPPNYTRCNNSFRCIPDSWRCDHDRDCADGSDEGPSCRYSRCLETQFQCASGRCISMEYRCDNEYDCQDHSDEWDCNDWCDPKREFRCNNTNMCLPIIYRCDNEYNCADKSDEFNCNEPVNQCDENYEFHCYSGNCIPKFWACDGDKDCQDGSDEINCTKDNESRECHFSEFKCEDGKRCIPMSWKCDLDPDCDDKSDELTDCKHQSNCEPTKFACVGSNTCLDLDKVCDNKPDCVNGTDEGRLCDYNMCLNHDCSHICHKSPDGFICACPENMRLRPDNKTCISQDVCERWGICSQKCESTPEGHQCLCHPGYTLANDRYSCKPNDSVPIYLIYSNRHEIRRYDMGTKDYFSLISGLRNTIALDYHYTKNWIFWTDVVDDKIYRGHMISNTLVEVEDEIDTPSITDIKAIIDVGLATTEGLAIDWIADKIYWVESNLDQIEVAKLDGSDRSTLIAGNMISPRAIVLDPREGMLFWTDWDTQRPRIERCSMSGDNRTVIYDITKVPGGGWPNGLTLDFEARRLYWVDARSDSIHTTTYDGLDHRPILYSHEALAHPFAISMFEQTVYWTDWRQNALVKANKFNGSNLVTIQQTFTQPFDLQVYHPKRQPHAINPCGTDNGGCSHLCLIGLGNKAVCRCPHRYKLGDDQKTCAKDNKFLLFVKENEIRGVDLTNANFNVIPSITVPFVEQASAIDYDSEEEKLYWTDKKRKVICSAFINGTGVETIIDSGIPNPEGFAIDWVSKNMYFSSYDEKKASISVAKLNGAFRTEIVSASPDFLKQPNSIAVHPSKGLLFWSDIGGDKHKIIRADMSGNSPTVIFQDAKEPTSLKVDMNRNQLYWISRGKGSVNMCNLDGTGHKEYGDNTLSVKQPTSLTIYNNSIYVANFSNILRIDTENKKSFALRENTPHVYAMQVYDPNSRTGNNKCVDNNGGCNQMCLPTGVDSRRCRCTTGFVLKNEDTCQGITSFLMYATESEIRGFDLQDSEAEALAPISKISLAAAVDFHAESESIFWVDSNSRTISHIKRDLTQRKTVVVDRINGIEGIAVDWIGENIYWTDRGHDTIEVSKFDGSNRYVVMHGDMEKPRSIAVHPVLGYVFFADWGYKPKIVMARLDGSNRTNWIDTNIKAPFGLTIDQKANHLYWCDKSLDIIERVDITTGDRTVIYRNLTDCMALAVFGKYIYWADSTMGSGSIMRALKSNVSDVTVLKSNLSSKLKDIKVFDHQRQIGSNLCKNNQHGCKQLCLYKGEIDGKKQASCACSYGKLAADGKSCTEYKAFLLFSEVTSLQSLHMKKVPDPNAPTRPIQNETFMKNVIGLAFDHVTQRVFYSDIQRGDIQSIFFNNTGVEILKEGVGTVEGLAFDSYAQELYWTSYTNSSISKMKLSLPAKERTPKVLVQLTTEDHPRAIVIDTCSSKMFWTNWNDQKPMIQTAFLNGFKSKTIISKNIRTPNGLTIDHRAQRLYWTDARLDKIERCTFEGTERVVMVEKIPQHSFGIAVYGDYIYWTDWMLRAVLRASKYDGTGLTWMKKGIKRQPMGIIAVANDTNDCTSQPCYQNAFGCDDICTVSDRGDPVCSCTEGHVLLPDGKQCVDASIIDECQLHDFVCDDRKRCISIEKTCNSVHDCLDGSDEHPHLCVWNRNCPADYFTCNKTGRCIRNDKVCDGKSDCGLDDESDEMKCPCKEDEFQCQSGLCINEKYKCDRDSDCPDHSDEIGCNLSCSELQFDGEFLEGLISCNTTSACIYPSWKCDGSNDCWDNSDEKDCGHTGTTSCAEKAFKCDSGSCIPQQWRCDKDDDCGDRSDERNCTYECDKNQFRCTESTCIPSTWQCDGHKDCKDGSDEGDSCANRTCGPDKFKCKTGRCIPLTWKCDNDKDCDDGADENQTEANCPDTPRCAPDEFTCANKRCIRLAFYCDGDNDCLDESDEVPSCVHKECAPNEFQCSNKGKCIPEKQRCDGLFDCPDHSDESKCDVSPCGNITQFQCNNKVCIDEDLVCNGNNDCGDMSDEPTSLCNVDECLSFGKNYSHVCTQKCNNKKIGYECACRTGYKLLEDKRTCVDVNECNTTYPCSHHCQNTVGSYICGCPQEYVLMPDRHRCKVTGDPPILLVSNRYYIRNVTFPHGHSHILTDKLFNSVAIDYDWQDKYIYWSDITSVNSSINRMSFDPNKSNKTQVLHSTTVRNPDGLAVDWIGRNLYWCDKTTDTIEVSRLDGTYRKVLVRSGLQEPRGLEVFPAKGLLFFTDWGDTPHISRIWMDGQHRQTIIKDHLAWPNALTIDYVTEKIYWADGSLDYIAMADLDGNNRRIVVSDNTKVPHVFALATFENYIFWSDWEKTSIHYADKHSGEDIRQLITMVHRPMDIQIVHKYKQLKGNESMYSSCKDNGGCSHLCLLRPTLHNRHSPIERVCACPENHYLADDKRTCKSNCTKAQFLCKKSSKCIPKWWKCDNHTDCEDGSDEPSDCSPYHCEQPGLFQCQNASSSHDCFVPNFICDGQKHCSDGSDEDSCEEYPCMEHQFKCHKNQTCIPKDHKCNGHPDCEDGEDEVGCEQVACNANQFQCKNTRCVPYVWLCDHDNDCGDGSDEPANCTQLSCRPGHIQCADSGRCIPTAWKCDGDPDCGENDDTDEKYEICHERTCDPTYFKCDNGHCIPGRWKCDYYDDCRDGSDEKDCTPRNCSEAEMKCGNGKCIRKNLQCDGQVHCEDGSDEKNCSIDCNAAEQFKCLKVEHCIPKSWVCDGETDCADGTDELPCKYNCTKDEFTCHNSSLCIPSLWKCDGQDDCGDNSDENSTMCSMYGCAPGLFRCKNNICIFGSQVCDGNKDCSDGSDETECSSRGTKCPPNEFQCKQIHQCISNNLVCDKKPHCEDRTDENLDYCQTIMGGKTCTEKNGGCEHICTKYKNGAKCSCKDGYVLHEDGLHCQLANVCEVWGMCSQKCNFSLEMRHHHCFCEKGFWRQSGREGSCLARGVPPSVLIAQKKKVLKSPVHSNMTSHAPITTAIGSSWIPDDSNKTIVAMDVDTTSDNWTAFIVTEQNHVWYVNRHLLPNTGSKRTKRETDKGNQLWLGHAKITDISVDWLLKRIYYIDATTKSIQLYNYDASKKVPIIDGGLEHPHSLAVDPASGRIFWTEQGSFPKIKSANMDGSDIVTLVSSELSWPNGIAVDHENGWVYWCDTKKNTIETISVDGRGRSVVHKFNDSDPPYKIDVFEDYLYVLTYKQSRLLKVYKFASHSNEYNSIHTIFTGIEHINAITIIQENKMNKNLPNNCSDPKNCDSGMCFNSRTSDQGFNCLCPKHATRKDNKCSFHRPCEAHCQNNGTCSLTVHNKPKCRCPVGYKGAHCETSACDNFCLNNGTCQMDSTTGRPMCSCPIEYKGVYCEKYVCADHCKNNGYCYVDREARKIKCKCGYKFTGENCEQKKDTWCDDYCIPGNYKTCSTLTGGQPFCECLDGFRGKKCEQCDDTFCYNKGHCMKDSTGRSSCKCQPNFDSKTQCMEYTCDYICQKHKGKPMSKCICNKCPGPQCTSKHLCDGYCKNGGTCAVVKGKPQCTCPTVYGGEHCTMCKCDPGGQCIEKTSGEHQCRCNWGYVGLHCELSCSDFCKNGGECGGCHLSNDLQAKCQYCICKDGFTGPTCEQGRQQPVTVPAGTVLNPLYVIIPAILLVILLLFILAIVFFRRRQRLEQYGHKRMKEPNRMDVKNPMYLRHEEDPDERDPLGSNPIFRGDATNFANPMYDVYNTSESMQMLLNHEVPQDNEENQLLEDGTNVRYFGTGDSAVKISKA